MESRGWGWMVEVQHITGGTYFQGFLAAALLVGPSAPSKVPVRIVRGTKLRLEGSTLGVRAVGQKRWQFVLPSVPPTSTPHREGILPTTKAVAPWCSTPALGPSSRPPAGAGEGISSLPHFGRSVGGGTVEVTSISRSTHWTKAHAFPLGHHVAPGVTITTVSRSVEIAGPKGRGS